MQNEIETAIQCNRCSRLFQGEDNYRVGVYRNNVCVEVICDFCSKEDVFQSWVQKGNLTTSLVMDAQSATACIDGTRDKSRYRAGLVRLWTKHIDVYREVMRQFNEVYMAARFAEIAVWFGRPDRADADTVKASQEWSQQYVDRYFLEKEGKPVPSFGLELGEKSVKAYYEKSDTAAHSYYAEDFKVLMMGSAGRVLTTISDNKGSKFGGANITLIYDETSDYPRGGIQSHVGTHKELLGLIGAYRRPEMQFKADDEVSFF